MLKSFPFALVAVCSFLLCTSASAKSAKGVSPADQLFMESFTKSNDADLQISRMVANKTNDPRVKALAMKVASGDQKLKDEMNTIVQKSNVTFPGSVDPADLQLKAELQKESSEPNLLDHSYLQAMIDKFHSTRDSFRLESKATRDADLKQFALKNENSLQSTLNDAINLDQQLPPLATASARK